MIKALIHIILCSRFGVLAIAEPTEAAPSELPKLFGEPLSEEDGWSKRVNGIQARFSIGAGRFQHGTWIPAIYIEFHNTGNSSTPVVFDFSVYNDLLPLFRAGDGTTPAAPGLISASNTSFADSHISLPSGATLKFPINWWGHGTPKDYRMHLDLEKSSWDVPKGDTKDYFLSASLKVPQIPIGAKPGAHVYWSGVLELPSVRVEAPGATAAKR
jgi:hypothetical protein